MESESSLPHSKVPANCLYHEPDQSSPYATSHFLKTHLNIIFPTTPGSNQWSLSLRFPHQNPIHASPLPHTRCMPRSSNSSRLLDEEYRSLSSSLCSFIHSPVTASPLGPNILLSTLFSQLTFLPQRCRAYLWKTVALLQSPVVETNGQEWHNLRRLLWVETDHVLRMDSGC